MTDPSPHRITRTGFEIRPADGGPPIRGDLRVAEGAKPKSAVVFVHGFKGFRNWGPWPALMRALALAGHAAVSFDFSRNGIGPEGEFSALDLFRENTHTRELDELRAVIDALAAGRLGGRKMGRIGVVGHSRGGGAAVIAAAEDERINALVTLAAIADIPSRWSAKQIAAWRRGEDVSIENARTRQQMPIGPDYWVDLQQNRERLDIAAAAARVAQPWLIVHGDADTSVPVADAHALFAAAGENAELMVVKGADHVFGVKHPYEGPSDDLRTVAEATLDWCEEHL
ncbi:MAG TPA: alpha/beta fold hydrolase [Longimicrobium sp.]|jgi:pimeloyl-ACP methyl ester carboxylesterase|nr:alpha/beta fold hydrolase [Longimicrobium sp.]